MFEAVGTLSALLLLPPPLLLLLLLLLLLPPPGVSRNAKPPHTTSQDWPRGGLHEGPGIRTDDSQAEVEVEKYVGML
jgi:hypothetical protein